MQTDIQTVTGANVLGTRPSRGETVTVPAYPAGEANDPITCDGTSGSSWLAPTLEGVLIVGLIAGLHQGGCYPYTSYSPPLDSHTRAVYQRAIAGAKRDVGPEPGSDDCTTGL